MALLDLSYFAFEMMDVLKDAYRMQHTLFRRFKRLMDIVKGFDSMQPYSFRVLSCKYDGKS